MGEVNAGAANAAQDNLIPTVKYTIAVSSGKGGVGKSTVAVNLAVGLALQGARVGLMDADVYGPNVPMMMGVRTPPQQKDGKLLPAESHGVKLISMGFFVPEETPLTWRGPMIHTAIQQFLRDVEWGELDYLLIDLPPGTGDAQLSIGQLVPLTGAVIVTTPQAVALHDSRKGLAMFQKINVPVLAIMARNPFYGPNLEETFRAIAPKLDFQMWDGVGHFIMMEKPKEFNAAVISWLDKNNLLKK